MNWREEIKGYLFVTAICISVLALAYLAGAR
jgi:hypothetical protein